MINAVLFGAIAGSGVLPLSRASSEAAIGAVSIGGVASLRGFALGNTQAMADAASLSPVTGAMPEVRVSPVLAAHVRDEFPSVLHGVLSEEASRLDDYQYATYAEQFLDRVRNVLAIDRKSSGENDDFRLTRETARLLALGMSYEDVIRVTDLKRRMSRIAWVRRELALEVVQCARLNRGYAKILRRGRQSLAQIFDSLFENETAAARGIDYFKQALHNAREAALANAEGAAPTPAMPSCTLNR